MSFREFVDAVKQTYNIVTSGGGGTAVKMSFVYKTGEPNCGIRDGTRYEDEIIGNLTFNETHFNSVNFDTVVFNGCRFNGCKFTNCQMSHTQFNQCNIDKCEFAQSYINEDTTFFECSIQHCTFNHSNLNRVDFRNGRMSSCTYENSYMIDMDAENARWTNNKFNNCSISDSTITNSHINGFKLHKSTARNVKLTDLTSYNNIVVPNQLYGRPNLSITLKDGTEPNCKTKGMTVNGAYCIVSVIKPDADIRKKTRSLSPKYIYM